MSYKLCEIIKVPDTKVYYEDNKIIVMDDLIKYNYLERMMGLLKEHKREDEITAYDLKYLVDVVREITYDMDGDWDTIISLRSQPQHYHIHRGRVK